MGPSVADRVRYLVDEDEDAHERQFSRDRKNSGAPGGGGVEESSGRHGTIRSTREKTPKQGVKRKRWSRPIVSFPEDGAAQTKARSSELGNGCWEPVNQTTAFHRDFSSRQ